MKNTTTLPVSKIEKFLNNPKSLPIVLAVITLISVIMTSQWGNPLG